MEKDKKDGKGYGEMPMYYKGTESRVDSETYGGGPKKPNPPSISATDSVDTSIVAQGQYGGGPKTGVKSGSNEIATDTTDQAGRWEEKIFNFVKDVGEFGGRIVDEIKHQYDHKIRGNTDTLAPPMNEEQTLQYVQTQKDIANDYQTEERGLVDQLIALDPADKSGVEYIQRLVGAKPDGTIGPKTRAAIGEYVMSQGIALPPEVMSKLDIGPESVYAQRYPQHQPGYKPPMEGGDWPTEGDDFPPEYAPIPPSPVPPGNLEGTQKWYDENIVPLESDGRVERENNPIPKSMPGDSTKIDKTRVETSRPIPYEQKLIKQLEDL